MRAEAGHSSLLLGWMLAQLVPTMPAAAAVTNAARYTVRPLGPLVGGALQQVALGLPLVVAGVVKGGYDLALWRWATHVQAVPTTDQDGVDRS